jgi:hypothetical protein
VRQETTITTTNVMAAIRLLLVALHRKEGKIDLEVKVLCLPDLRLLPLTLVDTTMMLAKHLERVRKNKGVDL